MTRGAWNFALAAAVIVPALTTPLAPRAALADWAETPDSPSCIVCSGGVNGQPWMFPDGAGGFVAAYRHASGGAGTEDIYAQALDAHGTRRWSPGDARGVPVCEAAGIQDFPVIVRDDAGGAIIAWQDRRAGTIDIYAQRVSAAGVPMWTPDGVPIAVGAGDQSIPQVERDGAGGCFIAWQDLGAAPSVVRVQRLAPDGTALWAPGGVLVSPVLGAQIGPRLSSDGRGGVLVGWGDARSGPVNVYVQRLSAAGARLWAFGGLAVEPAAWPQFLLRLLSDEAGGAFVVFGDLRADPAGDLYVEHVLADGPLGIPAQGICTLVGAFTFNGTTIGDSGRVYVAWTDSRTGTPQAYLWRGTMNGPSPPVWPANGTPIAPPGGSTTQARLRGDGEGGVLAVWAGNAGGNFDLHANRITKDGVRPWGPPGVPVTSTATDEDQSFVVGDGSGGAFVGYVSSLFAPDVQIHAHHLVRNAGLGRNGPEISSTQDVPADQGGRVDVVWTRSTLDQAARGEIASYDLWRRGPPIAPAAGAAAALALHGYSWERVASVIARGDLHYSTRLPTLASAGAGQSPPFPWERFFVRAVGRVHGEYWDSAVDSAYAVDDLAPAMPAAFARNAVAGGTSLHWLPNREPDLREYRLHRGASAEFVPGPANLIATLADTGHVDPGPPSFHYKLAAVDVHGNVGPHAAVAPGPPAGVPPGAARALWLGPAVPNPSPADVTVRFTLPSASHAAMTVLDLAGRRVATVFAGPREAGEWTATWNARDERGRRVVGGLYLVRLEAAAGVRTRPVLIVR